MQLNFTISTTKAGINENKSYGMASFLNTVVHPRKFEAVLLVGL